MSISKSVSISKAKSLVFLPEQELGRMIKDLLPCCTGRSQTIPEGQKPAHSWSLTLKFSTMRCGEADLGITITFLSIWKRRRTCKNRHLNHSSCSGRSRACSNSCYPSFQSSWFLQPWLPCLKSKEERGGVKASFPTQFWASWVFQLPQTSLKISFFAGGLEMKTETFQHLKTDKKNVSWWQSEHTWECALQATQKREPAASHQRWLGTEPACSLCCH